MLFVAHPGHELLLWGWIARARPRTCVVTDGSGHGSTPRLGWTEKTLRSLEAPISSIFGRLTDRELYSALLGCDFDLIDSLVTDLASELVRRSIDVVVADAAEGFSPAHDLCRALAGAACSLAALAGVHVRHYEYPIYAGPQGFDGAAEDVFRIELDDAELTAKIAAARDRAAVIPDIGPMLSQFGEGPFRRETLRPVQDWTEQGWPKDQRPLYERIGEERVSSAVYGRVIRYTDHVRPIVDHLRSRVATATCAS